MRASKKKRIRKSTRYFYIAIVTVMFVCSCGYILSSICKNKTTIKNETIYSYTNKFKYNYNVNLIENEYIDEPTLGMEENAYITDLIDNIDLKINYQYQGDKETIVNYDYEVVGKIQGIYTYNGTEQRIWTKKYAVLEKQEKQTENGNILIDENLKLNLSSQNDLVKQFEKQMGMTIDAKFILTLNVNTTTIVEGKSVTNKYTTPISIDLGKKTTSILGENDKEETQYISKEIEVTNNNQEIQIVISLIVLFLSVLIYKYILTKTQPINKIKNIYKYELNRILRLCQDKIVQVSTQPDVTATTIIDVKDFGEIIKVSEELFKPILYWASKDIDEAWFYVMSNSVTYRYILKG